MYLTYGSLFHIASILLLFVISFGLFFLFKKSSKKTQKILVFILLMLNLFQHLFKFIVWPQYYGNGFMHIDAAYNFCALLIIILPIIYFTKWRSLKVFASFMGLLAGFVAIAIPYWFVIEQTDLSSWGGFWEYTRFYVCHALLFVSSFLSVLFQFEKISWKDFWKNGLYVLAFLAIIVLNNFIYFSIAYSSFEIGFDYIKTDNFCWANGPKYGIGFDWLMDFLDSITFPFLKLDGNYVLILWYALPVYVIFTIVSFVLYICIDYKNFKHYKEEIKND